MKKQPIEAFRVTLDRAVRMRYNVSLVTVEADGFNGLFVVPCGREFLRCIVSDGNHPDSADLPEDEKDWEHVSVSLPTRCPTWAEMCAVKDAFWDAEETVIQFHPPKSDYVNNHPYCLHLWKSKSSEVKRPPAVCVGIPSR